MVNSVIQTLSVAETITKLLIVEINSVDMSKVSFLWLGILSHMGDRMWFFGAYLLLAKAFPNYQMILASVYGLSIAISSAIFSSSVGVWIDKTNRLKAATILIILQNSSVAVAAGIQILGMQDLFNQFNIGQMTYNT